MARVTRRGLAVAGAAAAVGAGAFLGIAAASGEGDDVELRGEARERAVANARAHVGGGTVTETEAGDDDAAYEVEVRRADGTQVEVQLDEAFRPIGTERDDDGADDRDDDEGRADDGHVSAGLMLTAPASGTAGAPGAAAPLPQGSEEVRLDPGDFTTRIDNPYWPMRPGSRWVYRETSPDGATQRVVVTVTPRTKLIANGVRARVVHDVVTGAGRPVEVTDDWYAQDRAGNVWYLGEATTEYEDGRPVSRSGSFEAGVDGAQAGIAMPAAPRPGLRYRQEHYEGEAEDRGEVLDVDAQAEVPFGHFADALMTKDVNPLEPRVLEVKLYARGVGPVLAVGLSGAADREELVSFRREAK